MPRPKTFCTIEGCGEPNQARGWCMKHYTRWLRTGDPLGLRKGVGTITSHGYRTISRKYVHRSVLMEKIGGGSHPCHWCSRLITWGVDLTVDHVDANKLNNDPENLVPSCQPCNARRGCAIRWGKEPDVSPS